MKRDIKPERLTDPEKIAKNSKIHDIETVEGHSKPDQTPKRNRLKETLTGNNKLGSIAGKVLDVASIFLPDWAVKGRKAIQTKTSKVMPILNDKEWYQSKTIWTAVLVLLTGILQALGVSAVENPETMQTIYTVLYHILAAFGLYGLRDAIGEKLNK